MDPWIIVAVLLLVVWAVGTFAFAPAPGAIHLLLSVGLFLLLYRIVLRGTSAPRTPRR